MNIKNAIKAQVKRWVESDAAVGVPGTQIISGAAGVLAVENSPCRRVARLSGMSGAVGEAVFTKEKEDADQAWLEVKLGDNSVVACSASSAGQTKEFERWVKRFTAMAKSAPANKGGSWIFKWALLLGAVIVAMVWLGLRSQAITAAGKAGSPLVQQQMNSAATPPLAGLFAQIQAQSQSSRSTPIPSAMPALPAADDDDKIRPIAQVSEDQLKQIKSANLLNMKAKGKPFYIFSNPTCSACQDLDKVIDGLKDDVQPVIIPVGFDADGVRLGVAALCSADPVAEWKKVMREHRSDTPLCLAGLKKIETNSKLFASLGFQATPTLVVSDGRGSIGSVSPGVLDAWVNAK